MRRVLLLLATSIAACSQAGVESREAVRHAGLERGYDALHYDLRFEIRPESAALTGLATVLLRAERPLASVELDAVELRVDSVRAWALPAATEFDPAADPIGERVDRDGAFGGDERHLEIPLDRVVRPGERVRVAVRYATRPRAGLHFALPSRSGVGHPPHVFTQGEAEDARYWFPCNDQPADRATHSISATVPADWITVAAGALESSEEDAATANRTDHWALRDDMPTYLFTFAAGPFVSIQDSWDGILVQYVVEPGDADAARASLADTPEVLRFLSRETGFRYPFSKYATVAVREFPYGGMENVSATTITRTALHAPGLQVEYPAWGLVAHEAAHQWFGDVVTSASWPHAWLNEGFASYYTLLFERETFGEQAFLYSMGNTIDGYLDACAGENLRAVVKHEYRTPFDLFFDGTIYPGGAARLQLLRGWLGDTTYRRAITAWLEEFAFRSADTEDFRATVERASGEDLGRFFDQWLYSKGYPELEVAWRQEGTGVLRVDVRQLQSGSGVPLAFVMPLDLRWRDESGERTARVWTDARRGSYELQRQGQVQWLEVDPEVFLPARITQIEALSATLARLAEGRSARSRALAVRALAHIETPEVDAALLRAARGDVASGVRAEAVVAFGDRLDPPRAELALEALVGESTPEVRKAWLRAAARHVAMPAVAAAMESILAQADGSPGERSIALTALASVQPDARLRGFMVPYLQARGEQTPLQAAALASLAQRLPDRDTLLLVTGFAGTGHPTPVRAQALGLLAPWLAVAPSAADAAVVAVGKALRAESWPLRRAAAQAAVQQPKWFRAELADMARRDPDSRIRRILDNVELSRP
ncbi:MAG TPA: M1 family metallopeptidase [Planctomycetota bacterium]